MYLGKYVCMNIICMYVCMLYLHLFLAVCLVCPTSWSQTKSSYNRISSQLEGNCLNDCKNNNNNNNTNANNIELFFNCYVSKSTNNGLYRCANTNTYTYMCASVCAVTTW